MEKMFSIRGLDKTTGKLLVMAKDEDQARNKANIGLPNERADIYEDSPTPVHQRSELEVKEFTEEDFARLTAEKQAEFNAQGTCIIEDEGV